MQRDQERENKMGFGFTRETERVYDLRRQRNHQKIKLN